MKTKTLFIKEWRECWKIGAWAAGVMLVASIILLRVNAMGRSDAMNVSHYASGWRILSGSAFENPPESLTGFPSLLLFMAALGVALAIRQFLIPFYNGEWGFLLHRPIERMKVLRVKLVVAVLLGLPPVLLWWACWGATRIPNWSMAPASTTALMCGLILLLWGVVAYCAVADFALLYDLKPWRWIKGAGMATAVLFFMMFCVGAEAVALQTAALQGVLLLLFLTTIFSVFSTREF